MIKIPPIVIPIEIEIKVVVEAVEKDKHHKPHVDFVIGPVRNKS